MKALAVFFLFLFPLRMQDPQRIFLGDSACSYYGEDLPAAARLFDGGKTGAEEIIRSIIRVIGLQPRFITREADIPNAAAVIYGNTRYVLYNPEFINELTRSTGSRWASVSILAHEIGHHLNGHTLDNGGSRPDIELEADEFSGFVLQRMGAALADAQAAMAIAASVKASHTHPARKQRLEAIARGWNNAAGKTTEPNQRDIKKPEESSKPEESAIVLHPKYIAADVHFTGDPETNYHVTIRGNLVKVRDDRLYIVGRLAESNKEGYPYMLYDAHYNYLYIRKDGTIENGARQNVGRMVSRKK